MARLVTPHYTSWMDDILVLPIPMSTSHLEAKANEELLTKVTLGGAVKELVLLVPLYKLNLYYLFITNLT